MRRVLSLQFVVLYAGLLAAAPAKGQSIHQDRYDRAMSEWELESFNNSAGRPAELPSGPPIVSADELRHPMSSKARHDLDEARHQIDIGNHSGAIEELQRALIKYPDSAPYAYNLLGREYIETREYVKAKESFTEAARLMPHESAHHSNLGLSLAILGEWDRAEQELHKALQLDPTNDTAKKILEAMKVWKLTGTGDGGPNSDSMR